MKATNQTRLERIAQSHCKTATGHEKFLVVCCHIDAAGKIQQKVTAQKWPVGDFQIVLDMLDDDFDKRRRAIVEAAINKRASNADSP